MKRTTIIADESLLLDTKYLAKALGKSFTVVVREALAEYVASHRPKRARVLSIEGIGHSEGPSDWSNARELIRQDARSGKINPLYGFTPGRLEEREEGEDGETRSS